MPSAIDIYIKCDDLDNLPAQMKENYLLESKLLVEVLPHKPKILQVGSVDGERAIRLLKARPDLEITGLEIEKRFVKAAKVKAAKAGLKAEFIHGDITGPPHLPFFDYVICLNNTLGYITDQQKAILEMKTLGKRVIISVYGEKFNDDLAKKYFSSLGLIVDRKETNTFIMRDFTSVRRYTRDEVDAWGGKVIETPAGYFCILAKHNTHGIM